MDFLLYITREQENITGKYIIFRHWNHAGTVEDIGPFIIHIKHHGIWWPGDARSRDTSNNGTDLVFLSCFGFSTVRVIMRNSHFPIPSALVNQLCCRLIGWRLFSSYVKTSPIWAATLRYTIWNRGNGYMDNVIQPLCIKLIGCRTYSNQSQAISPRWNCPMRRQLTIVHYFT